MITVDRPGPETRIVRAAVVKATICAFPHPTSRLYRAASGLPAHRLPPNAHVNSSARSPILRWLRSRTVNRTW